MLVHAVATTPVFVWGTGESVRRRFPASKSRRRVSSAAAAAGVHAAATNVCVSSAEAATDVCLAAATAATAAAAAEISRGLFSDAL